MLRQCQTIIHFDLSDKRRMWQSSFITQTRVSRARATFRKAADVLLFPQSMHKYLNHVRVQ